MVTITSTTYWIIISQTINLIIEYSKPQFLTSIVYTQSCLTNWLYAHTVCITYIQFLNPFSATLMEMQK